jgi:hypothetical protein
MKKVIISFLIIFSFLTPFLVHAQESDNNLSSNTKYFDIRMERGGQAAWNKAVTYIIYVTPKMDSERTQILWEAPVAIDINPKHKEFVDLYQGQTYTFKAKIIANKPGKYEISANLIAWEHDANYTNSVNDLVTFDQRLLAIPVDSTYTLKVIGKFAIIFGSIGLFIWILVLKGKKWMIKFKHWLTPPI